MNFDDILDVMFVILLLFKAKEQLKEMQTARRFWVRPLYETRDIDGLFAVSFQHLYTSDKEQFRIATRMKTDVFDLLFNLVKEDITKNSPRQSIAPKCRLFLTLVYLAHGDSTKYLSLSFKMGASTVLKIRKETCEVLWNTLAPIYLAIPSENEWQRIAQDYENIWNFPHCVGAIDGKHIKITCPPNSGASFYNYKGSYSIGLLAVCDANYTFTFVDIGAYGSQSDGGVLHHSEFGRRLLNGKLDLPKSSCLKNSNEDFPYFFIGDAAFPLRPNLMRPYPGSLLPTDKEIFNKRLSRARMTIENTFGVLTSRWRVLLAPLNMHPNTAESIVKAAVVLHNFVKMHDGSYCPAEYSYSMNGEKVANGLWRQSAEPLAKVRGSYSNNSPRSAFQLRDKLKNYLINSST